MNYNPYDLVSVLMMGELTHARVLSLDSQITDERHSKNADGQYVVPKTVITSCPKCGQPAELTLELQQPPFGTVEASCPHCEAGAVVAKVSSFIDPIAKGRVTLSSFQTVEEVKTVAPKAEDAGFKLDRFERQAQKSSEIEEDFSQPKATEQPKPKNKPKKKAQEQKNDEDNIG